MYTLAYLLGTAAAVEPPATFADKLAACDRVVVAEVTGTEPRWAAGDRGGIETVVWLAVERTLAGPDADTVEIVVPSGRIGAHATGSSAAVDLTVDGRYLLLLSLDGDGVWRAFSPTAAIRLKSPTAPGAATLETVLADEGAGHVD